MIRLHDIHHTQRNGNEAVVLRNINCEFDRRRHTAVLVGPPAIRRALIRIITGTLIPERGYCRIDGLVSWPPSWTHLFTPTLTAAENITFVSRLYGYKPAETLAFVREFSGLDKELRRKFSTLSNENKTRICFLTTMAIPFDYYLCDGGLAVGSPKFQAVSREIALARFQTSSAVVFTSYEFVARQFSRIYVHTENGMRYFENPDRAIQCFKEPQAGKNKRPCT